MYSRPNTGVPPRETDNGNAFQFQGEACLFDQEWETSGRRQAIRNESADTLTNPERRVLTAKASRFAVNTRDLVWKTSGLGSDDLAVPLTNSCFRAETGRRGLW
jgi:hypothetical protein